ncbi:hypothetical protein THRCLA_04345 [Thraustotheca clavata]|uniref:Uncharacterized protein n=1 Tax=Thraustotheca clavata TaxID=74557 RepID=A0A1V9ZZC0_9STRA|nr:hypothetical protein THRCLA_04345 [Thraustotheca clavata]
MADTVAATVHGLLAAGTFVLLYYALKYAKKYYYMAAFLLPPFVCFCMIYENIVRAATNLDKTGSNTTADVDKNLPSVQVMLALQACIIPFMLLICFEVTYLVHKNKSVNFCGISFESGHRANRNNFKSTFLRFAVWLVGFLLLLINLYVYYHYFDELELHAGSFLINGDNTASTILTEIPVYVLVILSLYMGLRLWNYGCNYAFVIHATCFNPWIWMVVGAIVLAIGYIIPGQLFATTSKIGEFVMLAAIIRMFKEVHHDLQVAEDFGPTMDRSLRDPPLVIIPRANVVDSGATISTPISSAYITMSSPREHDSDGERLTDANTNAYFSEIIARTKEESPLRPMTRFEHVVLEPVRQRKPHVSEDVIRSAEPTIKAQFEPFQPAPEPFNVDFPALLDDRSSHPNDEAWLVLPFEIPLFGAFEESPSEWTTNMPQSREECDIDTEQIVYEHQVLATEATHPTEASISINDVSFDTTDDWLVQLASSMEFEDTRERDHESSASLESHSINGMTTTQKRKTSEADERLRQRDINFAVEFSWTKLSDTGVFCTVCGRMVLPRGASFREFFSHEDLPVHKNNLAIVGGRLEQLRTMDEEATGTRRSSRLREKPGAQPLIDHDTTDDEVSLNRKKKHLEPMVYDDSSDDSDTDQRSAKSQPSPVVKSAQPSPASSITMPANQPRLLTLSKGIKKTRNDTPNKQLVKQHTPKKTLPGPGQKPLCSPASKPLLERRTVKPLVDRQESPRRAKKPRTMSEEAHATSPRTQPTLIAAAQPSPSDEEESNTPQIATQNREEDIVLVQIAPSPKEAKIHEPTETPIESKALPVSEPCRSCMEYAVREAAVQNVLLALNKQTNALQEQLDSIRMLLQMAMSKQQSMSHHV